jgi:hypothetical protein
MRFRHTAILGLAALLTACSSSTGPQATLNLSSTTVDDGDTLVLKAEAQGSTTTTLLNIGGPQFSEIDRVEFYKGTEKLGQDDSAPYELSIVVNASDDTEYSYSAKVITKDGQSASSPAMGVAVRIDKEAPQISMVASASNLSSTATINLIATTSDNKGVVKVEFYRGSTKLGQDTTPEDGFGLYVHLSEPDNGSPVFKARAFDKKGNSTLSDAVEVTVDIDETPPTLSLATNQTSVTVASSITLSATANDRSGISKVELYEVEASGNTKLGEDTEAPYTWDLPFTRNQNGTHAYIARALDTRGNSTSSSPAVAVTVDIFDLNSLQEQFTNSYGLSAIAAGDMNGDGLPEIVITNRDGNNVYVYKNTNGILKNILESVGTNTNSTGSSPRSVALADLNQDGKLDVITANFDSGNISVLLGNGDGILQSKTDYAVGTWPRGMAVADLNGDGKPDVTVSNLGSDTTSVLLGNGDGTLQPKTDYATGTRSRGVTLADMNTDGKLDLVVVNNALSGSLSVLLGNGDGTFQTKTEYPTGFYPNSVALADLNKDGNLDATVSNSGSDSVSVLFGNGNGTLQTHTEYGVGDAPIAVAVGNLRGNGDLDVVVLNNASRSISVLLNNGDGSLQPRQEFIVGSRPEGLALADLNSDGLLDVITSNFDQNTVSVLLQR